MMLKNKFVLFTLASLLTLNSLSLRQACATHSGTEIPFANAIIRPQLIEKLVRSILAGALSKGTLSGSEVSFQTDSIQQTIAFPPLSAQSQELMNDLGLAKSIGIAISPIHVNFTLPDANLKITVTPKGPNVYAVSASWSITQLSAIAEQLTLSVPKGERFNQSFAIVSSPVQIGLRGTAPIIAKAALMATVTEAGTSISLKSIRTNLTNSNGPSLSATLGELTVDGQKFAPVLTSNGINSTADEAAIRKDIQELEPSIVDSMRAPLAKALETEVAALSETLNEQPAYKYSVNTSSFLTNAKFPNETFKTALPKIFGGIDFTFLFSAFSPMESSGFFNAQVATTTEMDGRSIEPVASGTKIDQNDLKNFTVDDDAGIILYESAVKDLVESPTFTRRLQAYLETIVSNGGVALADSGIKIFFDPVRKSIAAVFNIEVSLDQLARSTTQQGEQALGNGIKIASFLENHLGSGKIIKMPVEVSFAVAGITTVKGKQVLHLTSQLPFYSMNIRLPFKTYSLHLLTSSSHCGVNQCPSNINQMTDVVRAILGEVVYQQLEPLIPSKISINLGKGVGFDGLEFIPNQLTFTQNHGLILTAKVKETAGVKK